MWFRAVRHVGNNRMREMSIKRRDERSFRWGWSMDAPIVRNYVNWTLPRAERQFSTLCRACTRLSGSERGNEVGKRRRKRKREAWWMRQRAKRNQWTGRGGETYAAVPLGRIQVLPFATVTRALHVSIRLSNLEFSGRVRASPRSRVRHQTSNAI